MQFYPHDLLRINDFEDLEFGEVEPPAWTRESILLAPWVVVRRVQTPDTVIPVGIRGEDRSQRCAAFIRKDIVQEVKRPFQLRLSKCKSSHERSRHLPALSHLMVLEEQWELDLPWGPSGSVGFELASGEPITTCTSDLDLCIFVENEFSTESARGLLSKARELAPCADISVETLDCAFSLAEFASGKKEILLKAATGPSIGPVPWRIRSPC